jgi:hypothetical protein
LTTLYAELKAVESAQQQREPIISSVGTVGAFRRFLAIYYAILGGLTFGIAGLVLPGFLMHDKPGALLGPLHFGVKLFGIKLMMAFVIVGAGFSFVKGSLALAKRGASPRGWVFAAIVIGLLVPVGVPLFYLCRGEAVWNLERFFAIPTLIGFAAFFAIARRERQPSREGN